MSILKLQISKQETIDLIISWLTVSFAFGWALSGGIFNLIGFAIALPVSLIAVGTGFIFHELAHKYVAIYYGAFAEYRAWKNGLILALAGAVLFGIVFAAPGAVYIVSNRISNKENGIISLAGPITNLVLATIFLALMFVPIPLLGLIATFGFRINAFLGFFNLIPFPPLDGSKVFTWNPIVWGIFFFSLAALALFPEMILPMLF